MGLTHSCTCILICFRYRGHVPTMKFDYGETYGNHTTKYFQDFRSKVLETSKTNYCKGGYFPTYYSYNPDLAVEARTRNWDRWLTTPRYTLTHYDHDSREQQIKFDKVSSIHTLTVNYISKQEVHGTWSLICLTKMVGMIIETLHKCSIWSFQLWNKSIWMNPNWPWTIQGQRYPR